MPKPSNKSNHKTEVKITVKKADPSVDPVVVSFPGGVPTTTKDHKTKFVLRRDREGVQHRGLRVLGKDSACNFQGSNAGRGYDGRRTKLCVGVYNKKKGTVTVYQAAEKGHVFALDQSIQNYTKSDAVGQTNLTSYQRRKMLFEDFGSSKKRRVLKSQEANMVKADAVVGAGNIMTHAFKGQTNMSQSNRKAIEQGMKGDKVSLCRIIFLYRMPFL